MKWRKDEFEISDDAADVDLHALQRLLSTTYWAAKRPAERTERGVRNSLCFSLKRAQEQVGFARVLTDGGCYAVVVDVVIEERFQRRGLGKWLLSVMTSHPQFEGMIFILWTDGQKGFYQACGFRHLDAFAVMRKAPPWMSAEPNPTSQSNAGSRLSSDDSPDTPSSPARRG